MSWILVASTLRPLEVDNDSGLPTTSQHKFDRRWYSGRFPDSQFDSSGFVEHVQHEARKPWTLKIFRRY